MRHFLFTCLFTIFSLQALISDEIEEFPKTIEDVEEYARIIDFSGSPSAVVGGVVNVISGDYFETNDDLSPIGANPIKITRHFSSGCSTVGELYDFWNLNIFSKVKYGNTKHHFHALVYDGSMIIPFIGKHHSDDYFYDYLKVNPKIYKKGFVNLPNPYTCGVNNLKNLCLMATKGRGQFTTKNTEGDDLFFEFHKPSKRTLLSKRVLKHGCEIQYEYQDKHVKQMKGFGGKGTFLGLVTVERKSLEDAKQVKLTSDDGREVVYHIKKLSSRHRSNGHYRYGLHKVDYNFRPSVNYCYIPTGTHQREVMWKKEMPEGRFLQIDYYGGKKKVRKLLAPLGVDETPIAAYKFKYDDRSATVLDAHKEKKVYEWSDEKRLSKISEYNGNDLYRTEQFFWGIKEKTTDTHLKTRVILDRNNVPLLCKHYYYDYLGFIVQEVTAGNITGESNSPPVVNGISEIKGDCDFYLKKYKHSLSGVRWESDGIQTVEYERMFKDSITKKLVIDTSGIRQRFFYDYDDNSVVKLEIIDDGSTKDQNNLTGVTERQIKRFHNNAQGLPAVITEHYLDLTTNEERPIKRTVRNYSKLGLLEKEDVYDANDQFAYSREWAYNSYGLLIEEIDPAGRKTTYAYDENGNKTFEQGPNPDYYKVYVYDFSNRLVKEEEIHSNGERLAKSYAYDLKGNRIKATDIYGNSTDFIYDAFDRVIERILPPIPDENGHLYRPSEKIAYNELNHPIMKQDANGFVTKMKLNIHGKPYLVEHPDGTIERAVYNLDGTLKKSISPTGVETVFTYDCFQRKTKEEKFSKEGALLSTNEWIYNTFHLLQEINSEGTITYFHYNHAGQLISESKGQATTSYVYDSLGRQIEKRQHLNDGDYQSHVVTFDVLNRTVEEKIVNSSGEIFLHKQYAYDSSDNKTHETIMTCGRPSTTITRYDVHDQPSKIIAPDGSETLYIYRFDFVDEMGVSVPYEQVIDPKGNSTVKIYNTHDKVAIEEKKNALNETIQRTTYIYDAAGHVVLRKEDLIQDGKSIKNINTVFEYDAKGREIAITEAAGEPEQKITRKEYNALNEIGKIYRPDGIVLCYDYDDIGRLICLSSTDGSVHYTYQYDRNNNIVEASDQLTGKSVYRTYDVNNLMLSETLECGLKFVYTYDSIGRLTHFTLPDTSSISYQYNAGQLKEVIRKKGDQILVHSYDYDTSGKRIKSQLPNGLGDIEYSYDICHRPTALKSKFWHMQSEYDSCNNVIKINHQDPLGQVTYKYDYDSKNQLTYEEGHKKHEYRFDSIGNRLEKDEQRYEHNSLNQLLCQNGIGYEYDRNGTLISKTTTGQTTTYQYDALGRLTAVNSESNQTTYTYDAFHRRTSKKTNTECETYLYQGDKEIGAMDSNGNIFQMRIMGTGAKGDIGAAVIMEFSGKQYVPLHDYRGNVCVLLDADNGAPVETYRYTAYGEETVSTIAEKPINPWRFSSKRVDTETGWSFFGARHYDPVIGRWTTPDPLWYVDGSNLYAYVVNQPTKFIDPEGLFGEGILDFLATTILSLVEWAITYDLSLNYGKQNGLTLSIGTGSNECCHKSLDRTSHTFKPDNYGLYDNPYGPIHHTHINGIFTSVADAIASNTYVNELTNAAVVSIYNATHGAWDLFECLINIFGMCSRPVQLLHQEWDDYFQKGPSNGIIIHTCHSQGVILTKVALRTYNPVLRQRIHVIAVAPGSYIPKRYCGSVVHLVSNSDFVPKIDFIGRWTCKTIVYLDRHPDANYWDHPFMSPTYKNHIKTHINLIKQEQGL